jgi:hypothetical protein
MPVISNANLGRVIDTLLLGSGFCSNLAMNFSEGPYAMGTFTVEKFDPSCFLCRSSMLLKRVPKDMIVFRIIS